MLGVAAAIAASGRCGRKVSGGNGPIKLRSSPRVTTRSRLLFNMFDALGKEITVDARAASQPRSNSASGARDTFDVFVFYDAPGRTRTAWLDEAKPTFEHRMRRRKKTWRRFPEERAWSSSITRNPLEYTWHEWVEMIGQACDWGQRRDVPGKDVSEAGFLGGVKQTITVVQQDASGNARTTRTFRSRRDLPLPVRHQSESRSFVQTDFVPVDSAFRTVPKRLASPEGRHAADCLGAIGRKDAACLHSARPRSAGMGKSGFPDAADECHPLDGVAGSTGLGGEESDEGAKEQQQLVLR